MLAHLNPKERAAYLGLGVLFLSFCIYVGSRQAHRSPPLVLQKLTADRTADAPPPSGAKRSRQTRPGHASRQTAPSASPDEAHVLVHVTGAVAAPSVYLFPKNSVVYDALRAARWTDRADLDRLNLSATLVGHSQLRVPTKGEIEAPNAEASYNSPTWEGAPEKRKLSPGARSKAKTAATVNLNSADKNMLETVPGIGPSTADRIIQYRNEHGPFKAVDELVNVPGIKQKKLQKMQPHLRT